MARDLLSQLGAEMLALDWRRLQQNRAQVIAAGEYMLDKSLLETPTEDVFHQKCELIYEHVHDSYFDEEQSVCIAAS